MKGFRKILVYLFIFSSAFSFSCCVEPISTAVSVATALIASVSLAGYQIAKCKIYECCSDPWVKLNYSGLQSDFRRTLHGQHLAENIVARAIKGHHTNKNPKKALVLAFHGWTGSGKNFVSKIIAENLYKKGMDSEYVHLYIATQHFPHVSQIEEYKKKLQREIQEYTKICGQSLFIFDEIDKMPENVIDVIKPYIDYYDDIDGVDYRKNVFIFLSNAGSKEITRVAFQFWMKGKERESITMKDIEPLINQGAFNEIGGLRFSDIVRNNLIDVYVPFLPLEKKHVKLCVRDELRIHSVLVDDEDVSKLVDELEYYPSEFQLYSTSGCKKIAQKVNMFIS